MDKAQIEDFAVLVMQDCGNLDVNGVYSLATVANKRCRGAYYRQKVWRVPERRAICEGN
jgi:hypothetical protein